MGLGLQSGLDLEGLDLAWELGQGQGTLRGQGQGQGQWQGQAG